MSTTACADCGVSVFDGHILHRTNPLGEIGIFKCERCGGKAVDEEVQEIAEILAQFGNPKPKFKGRRADA